MSETTQTNQFRTTTRVDSTPDDIPNPGVVKPKTIVSAPTYTTAPVNNVSGSVKADDRERIDLTSLSPKKEQSEDIKESYIDDIIGMDNPNSQLNRYIAEKQQEASEFLAQMEQEEQMEKDGEEFEEEEAFTNQTESDNKEEKAEIGFESSYESAHEKIYQDTATTQPKEVVTEDHVEVMSEDISSLKEEDEEDLAYKEEEVESKVEDKKEKKKEKPIIENPDIDLEVNVLDKDSDSQEEDNTLVEDDLEDAGNEVDDDEVLEHLQKLATERIKPVAKSLNLSSFTIMKKPTASIKSLNNTDVKAAKWVLPNQRSIVLMKEYLGSGLETLRESSEDAQNLSQMFRKYRSIYDHIVSSKPATYESWLKSTPYSDSDHYFFAAYIASFKGANYLPMDCENPKCGKTILTDDLPILDLVRFEDEESKNAFTEIYSSEGNYAGKGIYVSEVVALSNKLAVAFKDASIYNVFEIYSLSQADREKYASVLDFIPYIDSLYIIHEDTQQLEPIGYKIFPDNPTKTIKSKVSRFYNALKSLTVDEFTPIKSFVRNITSQKEDSIKMSYRYPAIKCPYCGTMIKEVPTTAEQLLFVRYQLGALANTSLK